MRACCTGSSQSWPLGHQETSLRIRNPHGLSVFAHCSQYSHWGLDHPISGWGRPVDSAPEPVGHDSRHLWQLPWCGLTSYSRPHVRDSGPFVMEPIAMPSGRDTADDNATCRRAAVTGEFSLIFLVRCLEHKYMEYSKHTLCPRHLD